jgi:hypothetical protein
LGTLTWASVDGLTAVRGPQHLGLSFRSRSRLFSQFHSVSRHRKAERYHPHRTEGTGLCWSLHHTEYLTRLSPTEGGEDFGQGRSVEPWRAGQRKQLFVLPLWLQGDVNQTTGRRLPIAQHGCSSHGDTEGRCMCKRHALGWEVQRAFRDTKTPSSST